MDFNLFKNNSAMLQLQMTFLQRFTTLSGIV